MRQNSMVVKRNYLLHAVAGVALLVSAIVGVSAEGYPEKAIRLVLPFGPGGASDFVARNLSVALTEVIGQQIVVDSRGGAAGIIGTEIAARAQPNGYTLFLGNIGTMIVNPRVYKMSIDPVKELAPITLVADVPSAIVATPTFPANSMKDLISYAKANTKEIRFASPALSNAGRFMTVGFLKSAGVKVMEVPYKDGSGSAVTGLMAGETEIMSVTAPSVASLIKAGKLKALAVTTARRIKALPEVPTMVELGYPSVVYSQWFGLFAPAATPKAIISKVYDAAVAAVNKPGMAQRFENAGTEVVVSKSPADFGAFVAGENKRWEKIVKDSGLTVE
jgi:tripartite-type tricarboxylate transporter receptor subunit TctC